MFNWSLRADKLSNQNSNSAVTQKDPACFPFWDLKKPILCLTYPLLNCFFSNFWLFIFTLFEKQSQRYAIHCWIYSPNTKRSQRQIWPKLGAPIQSRSPSWVAGTQWWKLYQQQRNQDASEAFQVGCRCLQVVSSPLTPTPTLSFLVFILKRYFPFPPTPLLLFVF